MLFSISINSSVQFCAVTVTLRNNCTQRVKMTRQSLSEGLNKDLPNRSRYGRSSCFLRRVSRRFFERDKCTLPRVGKSYLCSTYYEERNKTARREASFRFFRPVRLPTPFFRGWFFIGQKLDIAVLDDRDVLSESFGRR